jgi:hypothetical protein
MRKGTFRLLIAIAAVLAFAGTALGAGQVTLKTTVPNIPKSVCYQAGTITMEMDPETQIRIGDVLQFTTQNDTSICKEINYFLSLNGDGTFAGPTPPTPWTSLPLAGDTNLPVAGTAGQLVIDQSALDYTPAIGEPIPTAPVDRVYGFLVRGSVGSQIITMTFGYVDGNFEFQTDPTNPDSVLRYTSTTPGTPLDPSDRFIIRLFDQKKNEGYFWKPDGNPADAGDATEPDYSLTSDPTTPPNEDAANEFVGSDNALCIDTLTEDYQGEFVEATPDSRPISANAAVPHDAGFTLNFSGDYRIAKILPSLTYELVACKGAATGIIELPTGGQGTVADCSFDFEAGNGFCDPTTNNNLVIGSVGGTFPRGEDFIVTLEILVNGQTGDRGVYFSGGPIDTQGYTILDDACGIENDADASPLTGTFYRADGAAGTPTGDTDCSVASSNRFVRFTSQTNDLDLNETAQDDRFLSIDLPTFIYDTSVVQTGDDVAVRVTLTQDPCGTVFQGDLDMGAFGSCTAGGGDVVTQSLLYPYFTAADGTFFDSAFVIANIGNAAGGVTLYWYEADGDAFTGEVADELPANTIWNSGLMPQLVEDPGVTWTQTAGDGDQGDSMCYIVACTEFPSDGFAFIFGAPEGDSMGYIPRASATTAFAGAAECD